MALKPSVLKFKFDDFAGLPSEPDDEVRSEIVFGCGNAWALILEPGGEEGGDIDDPWVAVYLKNKGTGSKGAKKIHAKASFILRDTHGKIYREESMTPQLFDVSTSWGKSKFVKRSEIFNEENDILVDGALVVNVLVQIKLDAESLHVPSNPFRTNMLKLLENGEQSDVSFNVKGTDVPAHKLILKINAPLLFDFCAGHKQGTAISIDNVTPNNFRSILSYIYGGDAPNKISVYRGKGLIVAADQYGVPGLKLAMEKYLVHELMLTDTNVAEWLLFADAQTCPLLKEHAMSYLVARAGAGLMDSQWSKELNESPKLLSELLVEMSSSLSQDFQFVRNERDMSVNDLRKSLDEKGLDVDGSKTMLISRLQESNERQRTE